MVEPVAFSWVKFDFRILEWYLGRLRLKRITEPMGINGNHYILLEIKDRHSFHHFIHVTVFKNSPS